MNATLIKSSFCSKNPHLVLTQSSLPSQKPNISHAFRFSSKFSIKRFSFSTSRSYNGASSCSSDRRQISTLESLFCNDKTNPEQIIEDPVSLSIAQKEICDQARCSDCQSKGVVLCTTCSGSGLYVDSIMECQGIIVNIRCLNCGGAGNIMCCECGGKGHL